jgi:hypothetical protein
MYNFWFAGVIGIIIMGISLSLIPLHGTIVYDCRMSEISPDFPIEVRNECRKLKSGRI